MISDVLTPAPRHEWSEIARDDPAALVEHTPTWLDAIAEASRYRDASRLYRFDDGRRFVLPLVRRFSSPSPRSGFGTGWGIGGTVGADLDEGAISAIAGDLADDPALYTHVRPNPLHGPLWSGADTTSATSIRRRAHAVDLSGGAEIVRSRFRKSGRRGIRKAEQSDVEITLHCGGAMLDVYYQELYLRSVDRWAARQREPLALARLRARRRDPLRRLQAIARVLGPAFRLYLATVDGKPAAGIVVLHGGQNAHTTRGAMDRSLAHETKAAYALEWRAIQDACAAGCNWYQMGESGSNTSLSEYKERFGATAFDYHEYRFERLPILAADRLARQTVKKLIGFEDA